MNIKPLVSVVVPIYNAERYLQNCIESVLSQVNVDIELLLVDDGSSDNSGNICDEYAIKDDRIRVYHQINGGEISARSTGIRNAAGEYIYFVDADDTILPDTLSTMLSFMVPNTDIVIFESDKDCIYSVSEYAGALLQFNHWTVWGKLFRRELFDEYVMAIPRYFKVGGDFLTNLKILKNINGQIICKPYKKYIYNTNNPQSVQVCSKLSYEYEKRMIEEVDKIVRALPGAIDVSYKLFKWKMIYLGGMIGLRYKIDYNESWIISLLQEASKYPLSLKERIIIISVHLQLMRWILILEKSLKNKIRTITKEIRNISK